MLNTDDLLKILEDQNTPRQTEHKRLLRRSKYLDRTIKAVDEKGIVLVQGPRRSGKTTLMRMLQRELIEVQGYERGSILYLNLEDFRLSSSLDIELFDKVVKLHMSRNYPVGRLLFLIDEIQNIDGFERYLRTVYDNDEDIKFFVTGSNSSLLSKELGSLLTGRTLTIRIFPFSFLEFLEYRLGKEALERPSSDPLVVRTFYDYLKNGGIPEFLEMSDPHERLREYIEQVLFRDIMSRYDLRNERLLKDLVYYLTLHSSSRVSITQLSRTFGVSKDTISDYLSYLEQSYLINRVKAYSRSLKDRIRRPAKVYSMDPGLINSIKVGAPIDSGMVLETVVFLELMTTGAEIYYYTDTETGSECDFVLKDGLSVMDVVQVTRGMKEERTMKREINGLVRAARNLGLDRGRILNLEKEGTEVIDGVTVRYQSIIDFLLSRSIPVHGDNK